MGDAIKTVVPLRWSDMDAFGHINHAIYLTFLEEGRDAAVHQALGDVGYVVAHLAIDYRRELTRHDGPVTVSCWFTTLGNSSAGTRETIRNAAGDLITESEAVIVRFDPAERQSRPWSVDERAALIAAGAIPRVTGDGCMGDGENDEAKSQ